jgi:hypothetical protein
VFDYPTLNDLSIAIALLVEHGHDDSKVDIEQAITAMIKKYTTDLPRPVSQQTAEPRERAVVLLTGSTGNIGSEVLAALLANDRVAKVYTLNRPSAVSHDRQRAAFAERALDTRLLKDPKLVPLVGNVFNERLGLEPKNFDEVCLFSTTFISMAH